LRIGSSIDRGGWVGRRANAANPDSQAADHGGGNNEGQRANASLLPHCSIVISTESVSGFIPDALPG
jgi:hypothetical protein